MSQCSPAPWSRTGGLEISIRDADGNFIAHWNLIPFAMDGRDDDIARHIANADRIVKCFNLLAGVDSASFPAIEDWLKEKRLKPTSAPPTPS